MSTILYCNFFQSSNDLYIPLWCVFIAFILNAVWQDHIRSRELKRTINNNIFNACEKLIRYSLLGNSFVIEARKCYVLYRKGEEKDENLRFYYKFIDEADSMIINYHITLADLLSQMGDFKKHNKELYDKVNELPKKGIIAIDNWGGRFNVSMTIDEIKAAYKKAQNEVDSFVEETSYCKYFRQIQNIVHPK